MSVWSQTICSSGYKQPFWWCPTPGLPQWTRKPLWDLPSPGLCLSMANLLHGVRGQGEWTEATPARFFSSSQQRSSFQSHQSPIPTVLNISFFGIFWSGLMVYLNDFLFSLIGNYISIFLFLSWLVSNFALCVFILCAIFLASVLPTKEHKCESLWII